MRVSLNDGFMQMFKDVVAIIGITLIIVNFILVFYGIIMNNDRKEKLRLFITSIMQIIMLYGGYRMISYF